MIDLDAADRALGDAKRVLTTMRYSAPEVLIERQRELAHALNGVAKAAGLVIVDHRGFVVSTHEVTP